MHKTMTALIGALALVALTGCAKKETTTPSPAATTSPAPAAQRQDAATQTPAAAAPGAETPTPAGENPVVVIKTNLGTIKAELFQDKAPLSVQNFLQYVDDKFYDGTIFHRVIDGFMIQGGGFTPDMTQKPTRAPIQNESRNGLKNERGTLAMARTSIPDSATSQFYINVVDNTGLDYPRPDGVGYAVFGRVIEGMDVVDKIRQVRTGAASNGMRDVPTEPVIIESIRRQ